METPNSTTKLWFLFGAATLGMVVFATLYFSKPNAADPIQTAPTFVTNTVINNLTNVLVKETEKPVPAEIPPDYLRAFSIWKGLSNSTHIGQNQVLYDVKWLRVEYYISDKAKSIISEDEVKAKFELLLRRNGVPINSDSRQTITVGVEAMWSDERHLLANYNVTVAVKEQQFLFRNGEFKYDSLVTIWERQMNGNGGGYNANSGILECTEKLGELLANDFLSANPKP
jgi:hypothetical protein